MAVRQPPDNPYLAARQEWNERYGSYVKSAAAWRIVGIVGLTMAAIGFSYALYQSSQVKLVPYIVEVDKLGTSVSSGFPSADRIRRPARRTRHARQLCDELQIRQSGCGRAEAVYRPNLCAAAHVGSID